MEDPRHNRRLEHSLLFDLNITIDLIADAVNSVAADVLEMSSELECVTGVDNEGVYHKYLNVREDSSVSYRLCDLLSDCDNLWRVIGLDPDERGWIEEEKS